MKNMLMMMDYSLEFIDLIGRQGLLTYQLMSEVVKIIALFVVPKISISYDYVISKKFQWPWYNYIILKYNLESNIYFMWFNLVIFVKFNDNKIHNL